MKVNKEQAKILIHELTESNVPSEVIAGFLYICVENNAVDYLQFLTDKGYLELEIVMVKESVYAVTEDGKDKIYIGDDGLPHPLPGHEEWFRLMTTQPASKEIN